MYGSHHGRRRRRWVLVLVAVAGVALAGCAGDGDSGAAGAAESGPGVWVVPPGEAYEIMQADDPDLVVLDVRTQEEFEQVRLEGAELIDIQRPDFADRIEALDRNRPYVLYCRSGNRSEAARTLMADLGFREVYDIEGGISAWIDAGLPVA